ncbi:zinc-binding dehydrogenase [Actinoplanes sp. HUAS TT8]|uniref:zinc-binding dehydrogenase n=1 Tax=Actinoplanes sp. HUAS TT8 TaxID=3447453 RepID=UPI003F51FEB4
MRLIRYYRAGGPEVLRAEDGDPPVPGDGELLLRAAAIGVTRPAVRRLRETTGPFPATPGGEAAGFAMAHFARTERQRYAEHGEQVWQLTPAVHAELPLEQAARAHEIVEARENRGKVVLIP